ncbi:MBL fold metallo-hydrolase [Salinibaculum salinum]|uniref:MBL fold metallo-hydrolase n=1 Tax=Salinibaculum salinum TaxID=3131996 RepID=UPI0030EE79C8
MERLSLTNTAFEGNNNVYLFDDGPETVLIDAGDWDESTKDKLRAELDSHQITFADIDRIFLTHWHRDHTGLAGYIQGESGASVHVHERDAPLVRGDEDAVTALQNLQDGYFEDWGIPTDDRHSLREILNTIQHAVTPPSVDTFTDGDVFTFNSHEMTVVHTSGHADGLCIFEMTLDGESVVFSGDALLPEYTPNVGGADVRVEQPLPKYLQALQRIADADYECAYPGHREPIAQPTRRADEIIAHHHERAINVLTAVQKHAPCDTWTVSLELFGSLEGIHVLHGPGESYAHLEALERQGAVVREGTTYRLTDFGTDLLSQSDHDQFTVDY